MSDESVSNPYPSVVITGNNLDGAVRKTHLHVEGHIIVRPEEANQFEQEIGEVFRKYDFLRV